MLAEALVPTRQIEWAVTPAMLWFLYATMVIGLGVLVYGFAVRIALWRAGKPVLRTDRIGTRLARVVTLSVGHGALLRRPLPGVMHLLIFAGFAVLFAATTAVFVDVDLHWHIVRGAFYLYFQSLAVNIFGALVLLGVLVALWRRYAVRVSFLEQRPRGDLWILGAIAVLIATGFVLDGIRIAATSDPWGRWSPVGYALSTLFPRGATALVSPYRALWVFHVALWHTFLASIPFTKMLHVVTGPLNVFFGELGPARDVPPAIDFEHPPEVLGIRSPLDLTWKQLLDLDACTECGRCQSVCPAFAEGKPLSPKRVILDLRDHVRAHADEVVEAAAARRAGNQERCDEIVGTLPRLAGEVIAGETLWSCTTCRACEEICPVSIEHVQHIVGMRRFLAMEEALVPAGVGDAMERLETRGRPFAGGGERSEWYRDLPVVELDALPEGETVEILYWVGCAAAFDERARNIARSFASIMLAAGVRFAVLGAGEQCCGEPARRTGNEMHYDQLARSNAEIFAERGVRKIVTHCPHCLQALDRDYRQLGASYEVVHHTQLIGELAATGRLPLSVVEGASVTYHDPCYLGRYNGIFDAPRDVIDLIVPERAEMGRSRTGSFCCGSGGGHTFYEDPSGGRLNANRAREAIATGAQTLATGCPFCLSMLEDGVSRVQPDGAGIRVRDVAELVAENLLLVQEKVGDHRA